MLKVIQSCMKWNHVYRPFSVNCVLRNQETEFERQRGTKPKRKIRETVVLVRLIDQNDKILGLKPKSEAEKLAKKLNLSLEKTEDSRFGSNYPIYKFVSSNQLLQKELKTSSAKTVKKLPLNSRISDHDLKVKLQTVRKWIAKNCEVHIAITSNGENVGTMKNVLNKIQEEMKEESRIIDIRQKEDVIKLIILPPKQSSQKPKNSNTNDVNSKEPNVANANDVNLKEVTDANTNDVKSKDS